MPNAKNLIQIRVNSVINVKNVVFKTQKLPFHTVRCAAVKHGNILPFGFVVEF